MLTDEYIEYIADAQRRSIAQNRQLKFLYQTWWAWWIPRVFGAGFMIYFLLNRFESGAALFGAFLAISVWGQWLGRRNLAKARRNVRGKGSTTVVAMSDQGVDIEGVHVTSHLKWSAMLKPAIYPDGALISFSRVAALWLPDHALIEGSTTDVRSLLAEHANESATNGR